MRGIQPEQIDLPRVDTLATCNFHTKKKLVGKHWVMELPVEIRERFEDGADIVSVSSPEFAALIPDFEGSSSGRYSLPLHQDHFGNPEDPRGHYFSLKTRGDGNRNATTVAATLSLVRALLPIEKRYFSRWRERIGEEREYDERFAISKRQYDYCLDADVGLDEVVAQMLPPSAGEEQRLSMEMNILGYLIRGRHADVLMERLVRHCGHLVFQEHWVRPKTLFLKTMLPHGRVGGNKPPLQRNFWF